MVYFLQQGEAEGSKHFQLLRRAKHFQLIRKEAEFSTAPESPDLFRDAPLIWLFSIACFWRERGVLPLAATVRNRMQS